MVVVKKRTHNGLNISGRYIQLLDRQFNSRYITKFRTSKYKKYEKLYTNNFSSCIVLQNKIEKQIAENFYDEFFKLENSKIDISQKIEILENILDKTLTIELTEEKRLMNNLRNLERTTEIFYDLLTFKSITGNADFEFNKYLFFRTFLGKIKDKKILTENSVPMVPCMRIGR